MGDVDVLLVEDLAQQHLPARRLAAVLEQAGLRTRLVDWAPDDPAAVVAQAQALRPRLIALSILFAHGVSEHLALVAALRAAGVAAHCTMAGPLPSFAWRELLAACPALDSVLCGEAEASVAALATWASEPEHWPEVPGLAWRAPVPAANPPADPPSLDALPWPMREASLPAIAGLGFATVEASRGCVHRCTFCLPCTLHRAGPGPAYRLRSIAALVDEIEALYRRDVRLLLFDDEQFLPPMPVREERVNALAAELERRGLAIAFTIKCRADDVEEGLFRRLQALGLLRVYVGIESGHAPTLRLFGKGTAPAQNAAALATLDHLGIVADFRSLLFHPWSSHDSVGAELAFLEQVRPSLSTCFDFREVEVYPGTPLAARLLVEGRGRGVPWPLSYTIADPRAELLRRLGRFVYNPAGGYGRLQGRVTRAWFELLLQRRFRPDVFDIERAMQLRAVVAAANAQMLAVWREMLAFARDGDIHDAAQVNARAAGWAARIEAHCLE